MDARIRNIVFECPDASVLASFYAALLGMRLVVDRGDWMVIAKDEHSLPRLAFDEVPDYRRPQWPDSDHPQQVHIDSHVNDAEAAHEVALQLGAIRLPDMGGSCPVFADPAGHPFCLCADDQ